MLSQLLLAIGLPLALLIAATFITAKSQNGMPLFLQKLSSNESFLWNTMVGFSIAAALGYFLLRK